MFVRCGVIHGCDITLLIAPRCISDVYVLSGPFFSVGFVSGERAFLFFVFTGSLAGFCRLMRRYLHTKLPAIVCDVGSCRSFDKVYSSIDGDLVPCSVNLKMHEPSVDSSAWHMG